MLDTEPRDVALPDDFAAALGAEPEARRFFDGLSYSRKRAFVLPIHDAKKPETRERRIATTMTTLREGRSTRCDNALDPRPGGSVARCKGMS